VHSKHNRGRRRGSGEHSRLLCPRACLLLRLGCAACTTAAACKEPCPLIALQEYPDAMLAAFDAGLILAQEQVCRCSQSCVSTGWALCGSGCIARSAGEFCIMHVSMPSARQRFLALIPFIHADRRPLFFSRRLASLFFTAQDLTCWPCLVRAPCDRGWVEIQHIYFTHISRIL
jgi:hypothetical protein